MATPKEEPENIWIFKLSNTVWKAYLHPYIMVPVPVPSRSGHATGELELKTGIRVPYPQYSFSDVIFEERTRRRLIPWSEGAHLEISELNIGMKSRG